MNTYSHTVIGLTGPFGAGCTTIADVLCERQSFRKYSLSKAMREIASDYIEGLDKEKLHSPKHRAYQQYVGNEIRRKNLNAIPEKIIKDIQSEEEKDETLKQQDIVLDSIRSPSEMTIFRNEFPNYFVIAVYTPVGIRWERVRETYGGQENDFFRDDAQDSGESEPPFGQKVQLCVDSSDILISNERKFSEPIIKEELNKNVEEYIKLMKSPGLRRPYHWELSMAQAYNSSLIATCCRRKVGAVIVREEPPRENARSYIIASGYNEAPKEIMTCVQRGGKEQPEYCYRNEKMKSIIKTEYKMCPQCGKPLNFPDDFDLPFICSCGARIGRDFIPGRVLDLCIAVHAEEAAILQASKFGGTQIEGSTLYTTTFPCPLCAKMIVQVGIRKVVFTEPYPQDDAVSILDEAKIPAELFEGVKGRAYPRLFEPPPYKLKEEQDGAKVMSEM